MLKNTFVPGTGTNFMPSEFTNGASFVALSPHHPLVDELAAKDPKVAAFVAECDRAGTSEAAIEAAEKIGHDTGLLAEHPLQPGRMVPVWIANFILMDYGTGAIFGCPAHDQRDLDFARKYGLPVRPVDRGASADSFAHFLPTGMRLHLLPRLTDDFLGPNARDAKPVVSTDGLVEATCIDTPAKDGKPAKLGMPGP